MGSSFVATTNRILPLLAEHPISVTAVLLRCQEPIAWCIYMYVCKKKAYINKTKVHADGGTNSCILWAMHTENIRCTVYIIWLAYKHQLITCSV